MLFSIIIPLYNKENTIARCVLSVLEQSNNDFELIIVDDGSTDNSVSVVEQTFFDSRIRIIRKENGGVSSARNAGIKESTGDYVCFLDADDEWLPSYLENVYKAINDFPECYLINTSGFHRDILTGWGEYHVVKKYKDKIAPVSLFWAARKICAQTSGIVVKRSLLNEYMHKICRLPFPEDMTYAEDITLYYSLALISKQVYLGFPLTIRNVNVSGQIVESINRNKIIDNEIKYLNYLFDVYMKLDSDNVDFIVFFTSEIRARISLCLQWGQWNEKKHLFSEEVLSVLYVWERFIYNLSMPLWVKVALTKLLRVKYYIKSSEYAF